MRSRDVFLKMKKTVSTIGHMKQSPMIYRVDFMLPATLPETVFHKYGEIKYTLWVQMITPIRLEKIKCGFYIRNWLDLSACLVTKLQREETEERTFCCGPCISSPIKAKFIIKKSELYF